MEQPPGKHISPACIPSTQASLGYTSIPGEEGRRKRKRMRMGRRVMMMEEEEMGVEEVAMCLRWSTLA